MRTRLAAGESRTAVEGWVLEQLTTHARSQGAHDSSARTRAAALVQEVAATIDIPSAILDGLLSTPTSGWTMDRAGVGCRGSGDTLVHQLLAQLLPSAGALVGPLEQDDGGVVRLPPDDTGGTLMVATVDGVHSRLSHFPLLAGFHVARAALRDLYVMGATPQAMLIDVHLANDADVARLFDFIAGIGAVSGALQVPVVAGSTLRIGGDLVLGDRLSGCVAAVGTAVQVRSRVGAKEGDLLLLSRGAGGGTITTTALYHGRPQDVAPTLNLRTLRAGAMLVASPQLLRTTHLLTDVTNGGLVGDLAPLAQRLRVDLDEGAVHASLDPRVLRLLHDVHVDPLRVSIDALLLSVAPQDLPPIQTALAQVGAPATVIGKVCGGRGLHLRTLGGAAELLEVSFREAPYTPLKAVVAAGPPPPTEELEGALVAAMERARGRRDLLRERAELGSSTDAQYEADGP